MSGPACVEAAGDRPAFVFDGGRCTGCEACRLACGFENAAGGDPGWRRVHTLNPSRHPALPTLHLSLACNHCDTPACLLACPAAAYRRDAATGAVLVDEEKCIGCRYCSWVCPYDAPRFDEGRGVTTKCTFCAPRLAAGGQPACTAACPTGALALGRREAGAPEPRGPGVEPTGLGPALVLLPRRRSAARTDPIDAALEPGLPLVAPRPAPRIRLAAEWPLVLFTLLLPALAAWLAAGLLRPERAPPPALWLALGLGSLALSTLHLGRPRRAWRALLGLRTSWLSREVLAASLLLAGGAVALLAPPETAPHLAAAGLAVLAGVGLVVSIDGVYRAVARTAPPVPHPAAATLAAAFPFLLVAGWPLTAMAVAAGRALLHGRSLRAGSWGLSSRWAALRLALLAGACVPVLPWMTASALALAGEAIDRAAFFAALEPASPARTLATVPAQAPASGAPAGLRFNT